MTKRDEICIGNAYSDCVERADYIRHTQFAGSHPLCLAHATEDKNFLINDSYECWEVIVREDKQDPEPDNPWVISHD